MAIHFETFPRKHPRTGEVFYRWRIMDAETGRTLCKSPSRKRMTHERAEREIRELFETIKASWAPKIVNKEEILLSRDEDDGG